MELTQEKRDELESAHEKKYRDLNKRFGVAWNEESPRFVGETMESLSRKAKEDDALNNIPLRKWDMMAYSFLAYNRNSGLSLCEAVCMQKQAALDLVDKYNEGKQND